MRKMNVLDDALLAADDEDPGVYHARFAKVQHAVGAQRLGATVVLLEPGQAVCPYHHEVLEEEWLVVLAGSPTVRTPEGEQRLADGDVVCFPRGPAGAHRIFNEGPEPARVLVVSESSPLSAAVYPDSDKVGVFGPDLRLLVRRADARDYYDGEAT